MAESQFKRRVLTLLQELWDEKTLKEVCSRLSGVTSGLSESEQWIVEGLVILSYEGLNGKTWPTYIDLELVWVIEQLLSHDVDNDEVHELMLEHAGDVNLDTTKFGLVGKINELQPGLLEELPVAKRLRLLRFILKGCAGRPARLRGIANHVVCISPSLQSEAEAQFDSLQSRIKSEWLLASLFDPKKHQEDLLATLSLVENEIRFEQSRN